MHGGEDGRRDQRPLTVPRDRDPRGHVLDGGGVGGDDLSGIFLGGLGVGASSIVAPACMSPTWLER